MTTMVCFESGGVAYCVPVEATRAVRPATGIVALPAPRPDIAGMIPGPPPLTVISVLGASGGQILVMETSGATFGLLVDSVSGLRRIADADIHPAPDGQDRALVSGTIDSNGDLVFVTDPDAFAARL
jgi:chemotaxis signal transduction protein